MSDANKELFLKSMKYRFTEINNANNDTKKLELFIEYLKYIYVNWKYINYNLIDLFIEKINDIKSNFILGVCDYKDSQKKKFYEITNKCFVLFEKMGHNRRRH